MGEDGYDVEGEGSHPLLASVDDDSRFDDDEEMVTISLKDEDDRSKFDSHQLDNSLINCFSHVTDTSGLTIHKESV